MPKTSSTNLIAIKFMPLNTRSLKTLHIIGNDKENHSPVPSEINQISCTFCVSAQNDDFFFFIFKNLSKLK